MKKLAILLLLAGMITHSQASTEAMIPDEDGTKLSLWIPGFLIKSVAGIASDQTGDIDAALLKKIGNVQLVVREGTKYAGSYDRKVERKLRRMERKNYEELVSVHDEESEVHLHIRENKKGTIKRMIILVDDHESAFVYVKMNCRFRQEDLKQVAAMALQ